MALILPVCGAAASHLPHPIAVTADLTLQGARLVIVPTVTTNSSSGSALTWPPTEFTIDFVCRITDAAGAPLKEIRVSGVGRAEFSEFKGDHALSAKRAGQQALNELVKALQADPALRR